MQPHDTLIRAWCDGDAAAAEQLFSQIYPELQRLATRALSAHRRGPTLDTGALVQEACVRLLGPSVSPQSTLHLRAIAATAMRQIIVDHARRYVSAKRGGEWVQVTLGTGVENEAIDAQGPEQIVEMDRALQRLAALGERPVQVVECRFFAGLSEVETAAALSLSRSTVQREWRRAQAWLQVLRSESE